MMKNTMNQMSCCPCCGTCAANGIRQFDTDRKKVEMQYVEEAVNVLRDLLSNVMGDRREFLMERHATPMKDPQIVMLIHPEYAADVVTGEECEALLCDQGDFDQVDSVYEDQLMIRYDEDDVVTLGGIRYLLGIGIIFGMDENGNECSIDQSTIDDTLDFVEESLTTISVDGRDFEAFRLL